MGILFFFIKNSQKSCCQSDKSRLWPVQKTAWFVGDQITPAFFHGVPERGFASSTIDQATGIATDRVGVLDGANAGSTIAQASGIATNRRGVLDGATAGSTIGQASGIATDP